MTPFSHDSAVESGRRGGLAMTPAKKAALKALHESLRGVRQHTGSDRDRETVLADLGAALREPIRGIKSIRVLAAHLRVSDRTVRRWLSGEDWPPATHVRAIKKWLNSIV